MGWLQDLFGGSSRPKRPQPECPSLYDAGNYGGARYFCENTKDRGPLGQGTRITITDQTQLDRFCRGDYRSCPLNRL